MVPQTLQNVSSSPHADKTQDRPPASTSQTRSTPSSHAKAKAHGSSLIRQKLKRQGLSRKVIDIIEQSWKPNSAKQYKVYLDKWKEYCITKNNDPLERNLIKGLDFLKCLIKAGYSYSAINSARSALSCIFDTPPFW